MPQKSFKNYLKNEDANEELELPKKIDQVNYILKKKD